MPTATEQVDKSEQRIRRMFGEISPRYDLMNHVLSGGVDWYWRWRTVRLAAPSGTAPLLDVCTGTGDLAMAYWKKTQGKVRVVGTDFTHEMLVIARNKFKKLNAKRLGTPLEFLEADTQQLPFEDNAFEMVSVAFGLRNVTDTRKGLREMTRVCQPGGRVVVLEFSQPRNRLLNGIYQWYFRNVLPRIGQLFAKNREMAYDYLPNSVAQFPQGAELGKMFEECGLEKVSWHPFTFGIATLYIGHKPVPEPQSVE